MNLKNKVLLIIKAEGSAKYEYKSYICINAYSRLPQHPDGVFLPHFLGKAKAFVGLIPSAGRSDLYLHRQGKSAFLISAQHFVVGFGGRFPVIASWHTSSLFVSMLHTTIALASPNNAISNATKTSKFITKALTLIFVIALAS
jgi:hypothetical protein